MRRYSYGGIIYLIIGVVVASSHGYLNNINSIASILSALVAIVLWPLLFFGANLHLVF